VYSTDGDMGPPSPPTVVVGARTCRPAPGESLLLLAVVVAGAVVVVVVIAVVVAVAGSVAGDAAAGVACMDATVCARLRSR
jgi:hypothetical protein